MLELILVASIVGPSSLLPTSPPASPPVYSTPAPASSSAGSAQQPQRTPPLGPQQQQPTQSWADKMLKGIQERIRR